MLRWSIWRVRSSAAPHVAEKWAVSPWTSDLIALSQFPPWCHGATAFPLHCSQGEMNPCVCRARGTQGSRDTTKVTVLTDLTLVARFLPSPRTPNIEALAYRDGAFSRFSWPMVNTHKSSLNSTQSVFESGVLPVTLLAHWCPPDSSVCSVPGTRLRTHNQHSVNICQVLCGPEKLNTVQLNSLWWFHHYELLSGFPIKQLIPLQRLGPKEPFRTTGANSLLVSFFSVLVFLIPSYTHTHTYVGTYVSWNQIVNLEMILTDNSDGSHFGLLT